MFQCDRKLQAVITSWNGGPPLRGNGIIASNRHLHSQVLRVLIA
ncbi:MAG: hypothetical protein OXN88_08750 [Chloroflexota bacterium]|nr:hypothetical protein [Chloroflexota bacterium]